MLTDGLQLIEGSGTRNLVLPSGNGFPTSPDLGEVFVNFDSAFRGVYVYNGTDWINISAVDGGGGSSSIDWSSIVNTPTTIQGYGITGGTFSGNVTMGSGSAITLAADPASDLQAATKSYVDAKINGLSWKSPVEVATTGGIALSGLQTIDGVTLSSGKRVLVKDQGSAAANGIYIANSGAWARAADFDSLSPIDEVNGAAVYVKNGTANHDLCYTVSSTIAALGVDDITWVVLSGFSVNSPHLTGVPTSPTAAAGDTSTQIATTEYVDRMNYYDLAIYVEGTMTDSEIVFRFVATRNLTFPTNLTGSIAKAGTAATGSTVLTIKKNGTSVGTITFAASGTTGTLAAASGISMISGDVLTVTNQATADATLADVSFTIVGTIF